MIKKKFSIFIVKLIWNMISGKSFITAEGQNSSSKEFFIENDGLQQGTVNSPILFNIFNSDILNLLDLNSSDHKRSIAFADDLIIYITGKRSNKLGLTGKLSNKTATIHLTNCEFSTPTVIEIQGLGTVF